MVLLSPITVVNPKCETELTAAWSQPLALRGILTAAIEMRWQPADHHGQQGWAYPVFDRHGSISGRRWKNTNSKGKPKYAWLPKKPPDCNYYFPPGLLDAVADADGLVHIASGEPDLLAFLSAGIRNVMCWFGESSVPPTLPADLASLNVREVRLLPDRDATGRASAQKVIHLLDGTGITVKVYELPESLGEKGDVNALWTALDHDAEAFQSTLAALPLLPLPPAPQKARVAKHKGQQSPGENSDLPKSYYEAIAQALGVERYSDQGWSNPVGCPFHDDSHPSASWHRDKHILKCFVCFPNNRNFYLAKDTGAALGIDWRDHIEPRAPKSRKVRPDQEPRVYTPLDTIQPDLTTHVEYVTDLAVEPFIGRVTALQALTGEGKTTLAVKLCEEILARKPDAHILIVTRNTEIVRTLASKFGAAHYQDVDSNMLPQCQRLGICINSLPKLQQNGSLPDYGFLLIDESESVLTALGDNTFKGSQARTTLQVLQRLIQQTPTVVLADANLSTLTIQFAKHLRPDTVYIKNEFPHEKRCAVRLHSMNAITALWRSAVSNWDGEPVVSMWGFKKQARAEAEILKDEYGQDKILLVTQETVGEPRVKEFLKDATGQATNYLAILCTSVIANGIDIQAECRAVFVFQQGTHLDALTIVQMAGRFRKAKRLYLYQPKTTECREARWAMISKNPLSRAHKTSQRLHSGGLTGDWTDPTWIEPDTIDKRLLALNSVAEAQHNHSLNRLISHTDQLLSAQWTIESRPLPATKEFASSEVRGRKNRARINDDRFVTRICEVNPIDPKEFALLRRGRQTTEDVLAGYIRWQVEQSFNQPITPELAKAFLKNEIEPTYLFFHYVKNDLSVALRQDFQEAIEQHALIKRTHLTRRLELCRMFFVAVFGQAILDPEIEVERTDLDKRVRDFMAEHGKDVRLFFDWRLPDPDSATCIVSRMLKVMKLGHLKQRPLKRQGETHYSIDPDMLEHRRALAEAMEQSYGQTVEPGSQQIETPELLPTNTFDEKRSLLPTNAAASLSLALPSMTVHCTASVNNFPAGSIQSPLHILPKGESWAAAVLRDGAPITKRGPPRTA